MAPDPLAQFEAALAEMAPFMAGVVPRARERFGAEWQAGFTELLSRSMADPERRSGALKGYVRFALDAIKLQRAFTKERVYRAKTYAEAAAEVYQNEAYMEGLYLPGILLSHYLWPHHYEQLCWFRRVFLPRMAPGAEFCDVGVGSGFYSVQALLGCPASRGQGFDVSPHSKAHALGLVEAYGLAGRWSCTLQDVVAQPPPRRWPIVISVEVLEHLEDPLAYLRALRDMLEPGGSAFLTAAITAANADHIYLYETAAEVAAQLEQAGFTVVESAEFVAYEAKDGEPVPRLAAFVATR